MRVVEGAIGPDDRVVVEGLLRARPHMKVTPRFETTPAGTPPVGETALLPPDDGPADLKKP